MPKSLPRRSARQKQKTRKKATAIQKKAIQRKISAWLNKLFLAMTSKRRWRNGGIPIANPLSQITALQRQQVTALWIQHGCHSCMNAQPDPWISDHIPPRNLNALAKNQLGIAANPNYTLYPSCTPCSNAQAQLVTQLNQGPVALNAQQTRMIHGNVNYAGGGVAGSAQNANKQQRTAVNLIGNANGCHICGQNVQPATMVCDHYPPKELARPIMQLVIASSQLGFLLRQPTELRPQCRNCSNSQGAEVRTATNKIETLFKQATQGI